MVRRRVFVFACLLTAALLPLAAAACGTRGLGRTYSSGHYQVSLRAPEGFERTRGDASVLPASAHGLAYWSTTGNSQSMALAAVDVPADKDPRVRIYTAATLYISRLKDQGSSVDASDFFWVEHHPAFRIVNRDPQNKFVYHDVLIAGRPYCYLLRTGATIGKADDAISATDAALASLTFSGEEAGYRVDTAGRTMKKDAAAGYSVTYPRTFALQDTEAFNGVKGGTLIADICTPMSLVDPLDVGSVTILPVKLSKPHSLAIWRRAVVAMVADGNAKKAVVDYARGHATGKQTIGAVSAPKVLERSALPGVSYTVAVQEAGRTRLYYNQVLFTGTHMLNVWMYPGPDSPQPERIVRSIGPL